MQHTSGATWRMEDKFHPLPDYEGTIILRQQISHGKLSGLVIVDIMDLIKAEIEKKEEGN